MVESIVLSGILGGIGGFVRGLVGVSKALSAKREIRLNYYAATVLVAVAVGVFVGIIFDFNDERFSLLSGYAGTDILEGIYKSFNVQKVYVKKK